MTDKIKCQPRPGQYCGRDGECPKDAVFVVSDTSDDRWFACFEAATDYRMNGFPHERLEQAGGTWVEGHPIKGEINV